MSFQTSGPLHARALQFYGKPVEFSWWGGFTQLARAVLLLVPGEDRPSLPGLTLARSIWNIHEPASAIAFSFNEWIMTRGGNHPSRRDGYIPARRASRSPPLPSFISKQLGDKALSYEYYMKIFLSLATVMRKWDRWRDSGRASEHCSVTYSNPDKAVISRSKPETRLSRTRSDCEGDTYFQNVSVIW